MFFRTLTLILLVLLPLSAAAQTRTWKDRNGKTVRAKYVRVDGTQVVMLYGSRIVKVPLANLSEADQRWVRERNGDVALDGNAPKPSVPTSQLPKGITASGTPSAPSTDASTPSPKPNPIKGTSDLSKVRTWTDAKGNNLNAKFVRVHGSMIVLMQGKKIKKFSFIDFSAQDQQLVREHLTQTGGADAVAILDRAVEMEKQHREALAKAQAGGSTTPQRVVVPPRPAPPRPTVTTRPSAITTSPTTRFPSRVVPPPAPTYRVNPPSTTTQTSRTPNYGRTPTHTSSSPQLSQSLAQQRRDEEMRRQAERSRIQREQEERRQRDREMQRQQDMRHQQAMQSLRPNYHQKLEDVLVCSECMKELPSHIGAGDHCPHCRAYLAYEETSTGQRKYAPGAGGIGVGIGFFVAIGVFILKMVIRNS